MLNGDGVFSSSSTNAVILRGGPGVNSTRLVNTPPGNGRGSASTGGAPSYSRKDTGRDLPLSWIANSSSRRSVTGRPFLSRAVTVSSTRRVVVRNVGGWSCAPRASNAATAISARIGRSYFLPLSRRAPSGDILPPGGEKNEGNGS